MANYEKPNSLAPVPMTQLFPTEPVGNVVGIYQLDANGELRVHITPGCLFALLMLPYPFFCMGCCLSVTADLVFEDRSQTLLITTAWGYTGCFPGCKTKLSFSYDDVGNVGFISMNMRIRQSAQYRPVLVMKDGRLFTFARTGSEKDIEANVLGMHHFLFGRGKPDYQTPPYYSLRVPGVFSFCGRHARRA